MRERVFRLCRASAFKSFLSFGAVQGAQIFLPLLAFPYLSRVLGPERFGILMYMLSLSTAVGLSVEWGFSLGAVRDIAQARDEAKVLQRTVSAVLSAKLILVFICGCLAALACPFLPYAADNSLGYSLAIAYGIALGCNPTWYFQGAGSGMRRMAVWDVLSSALALSLVFVFIDGPGQWPRYLLFLFICKAAAYTWQTAAMIRAVDGVRLDFRAGRTELRRAFILFSSRLASMLYTQGNTLIIALFLPAGQLGILLAADKIVRAVVSLSAPVTQALMPEICAAREKNPTGTARMLRASLAGTGGVMLILAIVLWLTAPWVIPVVLGSGYGETVPVLRIMALFIPILACNIVLGNQILVPFGQERALTMVLLAVGLVSLPTVAGMASLFGIYGAACMPILVESGICAGYVFCISKCCPQAFRAGKANS